MDGLETVLKKGSTLAWFYGWSAKLSVMAKHGNSKKMKQPRTNVGATPVPDEAINRGDNRKQQEPTHEELVKAVTPKDHHEKDEDEKDRKKKR